MNPRSIAVRAGRGAGRPGDPLNVPPVPASAFHAGGAIDYAREDNPTWQAFEEALGALERGRAVAYASGIAAVEAVMRLCPLGGVVVAPQDAYSGTRRLLGHLARQGRVGVRLVDITDTEQTLAASDGAALLLIESPTNPMLGVADVPVLVDGARGLGVRVAVDNTFPTPMLARPLDAGADLVIHSVTKFLAGHSDLVLGAVVARDPDVGAWLADERTSFGAVPGPFETWLALRGMRTLALRVERGQENALTLAHRLEADPRVVRVRYPGLPTDPWHARARTQFDGPGAMLSFELPDADRADRFCGAVRLAVHATSLGGVETMLERRARQWGEEAVPEGLIRVSVGCEDVEDLWADFAAALAEAAA